MSDKEKTFGQFETPPDVADLLLGFCMRRPGERLLDPSCGAGAFLSRAAQLQSWMDPGQSHDDTLWGVELDSKAAELARNRLPQARIIESSFFEMEPAQDRLFDVVIGNPPYTRAEWIEKVVGKHQPAQQLAFFENQADSEASGPSSGPAILGGRAGLYAHFFLHSARFLRENGRLGFVVPNSWLDVAYGQRLKRFLLDHFRVLALIESNVERWFSRAQVNTCLVLLERCSDLAGRASSRTRFIRLKRPLNELITFGIGDAQRLSSLERLTTRLLPNRDYDGADFSIRVVAQNRISAREKWGVALRAPAVYQNRRKSSELLPLKNWAVIERGFTTGANAFFYLNESSREKSGIEARYLKPLLKSLRGAGRRQLSAADSQLQVLIIPPEAVLADTATSQYVAWGESQGWHQRRTCAGRDPWYSLPPQKPADLLIAKGIWNRHFCPLLKDQIHVDQQIYQVRLAEGVSTLAAAALLNSAWFALQLELQGRINFGEGVLWLAAYELNDVRLPDPRYLQDRQVEELANSFEALLKRPVANVAEELSEPVWQHLNETVYRVVGLTAEEASAATGALLERVGVRLVKARTFR